MSSTIGGEVTALLVGGAVAAPFLIAAGAAWGLAKTAQFLAKTGDEAWERHECIQSVRRQETALAEGRYSVYLAALKEYEIATRLANLDWVEPTAVEPDASLAQLQDATVQVLEAAALLRLKPPEVNPSLLHSSEFRAVDATSDLVRHAAELAAHDSAVAEPDSAEGRTAADRERSAESLRSDSAQGEAERTRTHIGLAAAVVTSLAGWDTPAAKEITDRANEFLRGEAPWNPDLINNGRDEQERAAALLRDIASRSALAACLESLGYEVGETFTTITGEPVVVQMPKSETHSVSVNFYEAGFDMTVVRTSGAPDLMARAAQDDAAHDQFCRDFSVIQKTAKEQNVDIRVDLLVEPGTDPAPEAPARPPARPRAMERPL